MSLPSSDVLLTRMMTLHPKIIDLTLGRVWRLLEALDNPEKRMPPVIHVAGTNGKGSTVAMLRAGIEGAGQTAHAYTSPHLVRFHERIRLAGELISEDALSQILDRCEARNNGENITYFEITTIAALLAFAETPADWTLLEVGLGGRLDATNVIDAPKLTVITPVSLDHQQFLGETIAEIAFEKAGILKRNVPCVVGPQTDEGLEVIERQAEKVGAPLLTYGQHWRSYAERGRLIVEDDHGLLDLPLPVLSGGHQILNAGGAVVGLRALGFDAAACEAAVTNADWPARMQRLRRGPLPEAAPEAEIWLDGGHNPAAGRALAALLANLPDRPTEVICGMLRTKDANGFLRPLVGQIDHLQGVSIPGESATLPGAEVVAAALEEGLSAVEAPSLDHAVRDIIARSAHARIIICGSLYLAGAVLRDNG